MTALQAFVLGLTQGATEFLPVSSSGHLELVERLLGLELESSLFFDTLLHLATLLAVFMALAPELAKLFRGFFGAVAHPATLADSFRAGGSNRMLLGLVIATVPATLAAFLLQDELDSLLPGRYLGLGFLITAVVLCMGELVSEKVQQRRLTEAAPSDALFVGFAQALALLPGVSRSGMTITAGRAVGFTRMFAVKFSFLMSAVAILGGTLLQLPDAISQGLGGIGVLPVIIGMLTAAISGFLSIVFLIKLLQKRRMVYFAAYTALLGLLIFIGVLG